ncbi:MAG: preprotein translocase subunit SecY [Rudaea sp.]|jgi:preprotein translocase subunit SecY|uniref:preprotein translocase subunit SecY n=1 Tax=unclassified Rudaea TaxID=2627037 RepID=UPI0010FA2D73|nr:MULTISPECIES: preprotein translocase subunit SecY [unclassified Rudaea]MBN8884123.1 preprotein translocase subunit SecY [Rudaea sp.]
MAASQASMLAGLGKLTELKQRVLFLIGALIVYRLGSFIPVPGVKSAAMTSLLGGGGGLIDLANMFSGGALARFSIFALGVVPYISASIIVQMVAQVVPSLQSLRKEGESGRRKLTQWTRYFTVVLAAVQSFGISSWLMHQTTNGQPVVYAPGIGFIFTSMIALTSGTLFLMWLGEQITERGIGNGISMLIFAGIVAGLPGATYHTLQMAQNGELNFVKVLLVLLIVVAVTAFVVFVERGQRRITVNYARRQGGSQAYMNQSSHLPLKLNMSGVIPAIFASSLIMFPATASSWFSNGADIRWLQQVTAAIAPGEPLYEILYAILIIVFAFFYTALVFNSNETAENLKKSGALIPGIRPGKSTAEYIDGVLTRLTGAGALYLVLVCVVPTFLQQYFHVPFYFGGTSLLIVVVVVMDFTAQVQAHLVSHQYESLLKKANLKGYGRGGSPAR